MAACRRVRLPPADRPAVPLAERGLSQLRRFPRRARLTQAQGDPQRTARGAERRDRDRMGDRDAISPKPIGTRSSTSTWTPARANGARPISRGRASACSARPWPIGFCWCSPSGRALCRRRAERHRPRHAVWPLLGRASRTTPSCISRSATTRPSNSLFEHQLARVEAGAQGAHKLARGYLPSETYSAHYIADPGLRRAVADYLKRERRAVAREIALLTEEAPFTRLGGASPRARMRSCR